MELKDFSTLEVAAMLGMSVRSVQLMVDRGELQAWKTPGGHRRIARASVERWRSASSLSGKNVGARVNASTGEVEDGSESPRAATGSILLIDDSVHFQKLVSLLVQQHFPCTDLHVADDGISGLALYGRIQPDVLLVDILLPGIDGAALITSLRSHPQFAQSRLGVVTSLAEHQLAPYAFALHQVPVIHKPRLVMELPELLGEWLATPRVQLSTPGNNPGA